MPAESGNARPRQCRPHARTDGRSWRTRRGTQIGSQSGIGRRELGGDATSATGEADKKFKIARSAILADEAKSDAFFSEDRRKLANLRQLYRRVPPTQEWAENNHDHLPIQAQIADLIPVGAFWLDFVKHTGDTPFLSKNAADASAQLHGDHVRSVGARFAIRGRQSGRQVRRTEDDVHLARAGHRISLEEVRPAGGPAAVAQVLGQSEFLIAMAIASARKKARKSTSSSPANS